MQQSWIKTGFIGGLLGALAFVLFIMIAYGIYGNPFLPQVKSLDFFIYLMAITISLLFYRFRQNFGVLHFWQGLRLATLTSTILLLFSVAFLLVLFNVIDQDLVKLQANYEINQFIKQKESFLAFVEQQKQDGEPVYQETLKNLKKRDWAYYFIKQEIAQKLTIGLLISLVASALLRQKPSNQIIEDSEDSNRQKSPKNTKNGV